MVVCAVLGLALVLTQTIEAFGRPGAPERYGATLRSILAAPTDGGTVATVNGIRISQQTVDIETANRLVFGGSTIRDDVLDSLVSRYVVLAEAQRRGISVSAAEFAAFVQSQRSAADADPERSMYRYAEALGIGAQGIWSYGPAVQAWREALTYGAVKRLVLGDVSPELVAAKEVEWENYVASLRAAATVEVAK